MYKILCLTDFSNPAHNALRYATWFTSATNSSLTLLHVVLEKAFFEDEVGGGSSSQEELMEHRLEKANKRLIACRDKVLTGNSDHLPCDYRTGSGTLLDVVTYYCEQEGYDLVIMGTTGTSGDTLEDLMIGSNAVNLFEHLKVPVISVPLGSHRRKLQRMVMATDFQPLDERVAQESIRICAPFHAQLHLVHVNSSRNEAEKQQLVEFTKPLAQQYDHLHFNSLPASDPEGGILRFADDIGADMIVLVGKRYGFIEKIFVQSAIELVSYYTRVPLLVFPAGWKEKHVRQNESVNLQEPDI